MKKLLRRLAVYVPHLATLGAALTATVVICYATWGLDPAPPEPPEPCKASAYEIHGNALEIECTVGARVSLDKVRHEDETRGFVLCQCLPLPDAGPPDASL
jgi:hypothetical protein